VGMAVSTVLPSKSSIAPAVEVVASFIEVHEQGRKLGRGPRRPEARSPPVRRNWPRHLRGVLDVPLGLAMAPAAGPCSMPCTVSRGIIDSSNVGMSGKTLSEKPWKEALSMARRQARCPAVDVAGGLDEARADTRVSVETNVECLERRASDERGRGPWRPWSRRREDESHCKALKPSPFNGCSCIIGTSSWASKRARPSRIVRPDERRPSRKVPKTATGSFQAQGSRLSRVADLDAKALVTRR
jgi:hypothetical protein